MDDNQFIRYYRHILLDEIGEQGQQRINDAKVVIIGVGGLGCPASQYLAASGVGHIALIDPDKIELSNLQRQILYCQEDIGEHKVLVAATRLAQINPTIRITPVVADITQSNLTDTLHAADVVLDCTDNHTARLTINRLCLETQTKLVSAAAMGTQGQLICFDFSHGLGPCYQCLFPDDHQTRQGCEQQGVFSPLLGVMGSMQAAQALQMLIGKSPQIDRLHRFDMFGVLLQSLTLNTEPDCQCCSAKAAQSTIIQ